MVTITYFPPLIPYVDVPASPQILVSRVLASSMNYFEAEITWEPPANDSRVDAYHYQVICNVNTSVILESITTKNTTVFIDTNGPGVNISFVLTACNCKGRSAPVTLNLATVLDSNGISYYSYRVILGQYMQTKFLIVHSGDQFITDINVEATFIPSNITFPVETLGLPENSTLIVLVYSLCGAILLILLLICLVLTSVFLKLLIKKLSCTSQPRFLEDKIASHGPTYEEIVDLQCKCSEEMDILKVDLSLMLNDKSETMDRAPVHDNVTEY